MSNTAGILYEAGTAYRSRVHELIPVFWLRLVRDAHLIVFF